MNGHFKKSETSSFSQEFHLTKNSNETETFYRSSRYGEEKKRRQFSMASKEFTLPIISRKLPSIIDSEVTEEKCLTNRRGLNNR